MGPFKGYVTHTTGGVEGVCFPGKKRYEGGGINVISVTRGWVGVKFRGGGKRYVTLEWPLSKDPPFPRDLIGYLGLHDIINFSHLPGNEQFFWEARNHTM